MNLMSVILTAVIGGNIVLTQFVDISLLRNLRKLDVAFFVGMFMIDITLVSGLMFYGIYHLVLVPMDLIYLSFLSSVMIIALVSQAEWWILKRFFPKWHEAYGFYFPLVTTNAVITFVLMSFITSNLSLWDVVVSSLAVPLGFVMINLLMVIYQERLERTSRIPGPFQGLSMTLIILALIAMTFVGLGGL
jgi:Na+-translocating ferredoxin:NAD+ oxidoreductase RnfA subunit